MATILTSGTCDVCKCIGWTLMYRGQRCLRCIRDATLVVPIATVAK